MSIVAASTSPHLIFHPARPSRRAMTLIELTVVVAIVAVLAMLLAPRLAFLRTMSLHAGSATSIQDVMQNMLTYHASQAKWPDRFDSLLNSSNTLYGSGTGAAYGLDSNLKNVLSLTTLDANTAKSLSGLIGQPSGGSTVMEYVYHDEAANKPGNSGTAAGITPLASGSTVAIINTTQNPITSTSADPNAASGSLIYNTVYPDGQNPNNEILVAMGVGPLNRAISKTIVTPPQLYLKDGTRYNRVIVIFRVRPDGVQASLAGAISPDGRTLDQCMGNYRTTAER